MLTEMFPKKYCLQKFRLNVKFFNTGFPFCCSVRSSGKIGVTVVVIMKKKKNRYFL